VKSTIVPGNGSALLNAGTALEIALMAREVHCKAEAFFRVDRTQARPLLRRNYRDPIERCARRWFPLPLADRHLDIQ